MQEHGYVLKIGRRSGRVLRRTAVGGFPDSVTTVGGSVWVGDGFGPGPSSAVGHDALIELDGRSAKVRSRVALRDPYRLAAGRSGLWVLSSGGSAFSFVRHVDPLTKRVAASIRVRGSGFAPDLVVAPTSVWTITTLYGPHRSLLSRIDPSTNRVTAVVTLRGLAESIAFGAGLVWVATATVEGGKSLGVVTAYSPRTARPVGRPLRLPAAGPIAFGHGRLWIFAKGSILSFDSRRRVQVGSPLRVTGLVETIEVGDGDVWVLERLPSRLVRLGS